MAVYDPTLLVYVKNITYFIFHCVSTLIAFMDDLFILSLLLLLHMLFHHILLIIWVCLLFLLILHWDWYGLVYLFFLNLFDRLNDDLIERVPKLALVSLQNLEVFTVDAIVFIAFHTFLITHFLYSAPPAFL